MREMPEIGGRVFFTPPPEGGVGGGGMKQVQRPRDMRVPCARRLRRDVTDAEQKLWRHLKRLSLPQSHFRRQAAIGPYFADFACHEVRLVIEVDGGQHNETTGAAADAARTAYLTAQGYRVLRFWDNEVLENIDGVLGSIDEVLKATTPPTPDPSPPQAGGGETARRRRSIPLDGHPTPARFGRRPSPSRGG